MFKKIYNTEKRKYFEINILKNFYKKKSLFVLIGLQNEHEV